VTDHIKAKILHLTRHPFRLGDLIHGNDQFEIRTGERENGSSPLLSLSRHHSGDEAKKKSLVQDY
jgi:hypothetical protein